jgi:hypothetical protein
LKLMGDRNRGEAGGVPLTACANPASVVLFFFRHQRRPLGRGFGPLVLSEPGIFVQILQLSCRVSSRAARRPRDQAALQARRGFQKVLAAEHLWSGFGADCPDSYFGYRNRLEAGGIDCSGHREREVGCRKAHRFVICGFAKNKKKRVDYAEQT